MDPVLNEALDLVIKAVASAVGLVAVAWIRRKAEVARQLATSREQAQAIVRLESIVADAVAEAEQTIVRAAKAAAADGKLTREDAERACDAVVAVVKRHMGGDGGFAALGHLLGTVVDDGRIRTMIESQLRRRR